jgi:NADH dehydrogenase
MQRATLIGYVVGAIIGVIGAVLFVVITPANQLANVGWPTEVHPVWVLHIVFSGALGALTFALFPSHLQRTHGPAAGLLWSLAFGVAGWILFALNLFPLFTGRPVQWESTQAVRYFPLLPIYLLQALLVGIGNQWLGMRTPPETPVSPPVSRRVVVVGGGFAGVGAAQKLEQLFASDPSVEIILISKSNHLLFTPMLSEVTSGGVEAQHIAPPLRSFFRNVTVIKGDPLAVDSQARLLTYESGTGVQKQIDYEHLILAVGAIPNFFGNKNIEQNTFTFKSLSDAVEIRNHLIRTLERADGATPAERKALLTYVVVGAGFAGAELMGGMNDFVRGALWYYPNLKQEEVSMVLIHPGDRILPELSESLAVYAQEKLVQRGVSLQLKTKVTDCAPGQVVTSQSAFGAETIVWTAGNVPHPICSQVGAEVDRRGAIMTDEHLRVKGVDRLWAIGDCALIPDLITGKNCPPTAQYAQREAKAAAYNIHAVMTGQPVKPFSFRSIGSLAVLGHLTACAEIRGLKFSGLLAWLMWRGIYLVKLPTLEKKIRVLFDWVIDLFFPRDLGSFPLSGEEFAQSGRVQLTPAPSTKSTESVGA